MIGMSHQTSDVYQQTIAHISQQRARLNQALSEARDRMLARIAAPAPGLPQWMLRPSSEPVVSAYQMRPGQVATFRRWADFPSREGRNVKEKPPAKRGRGRAKKKRAA